jgi:hypothetical protein
VILPSASVPSLPAGGLAAVIDAIRQDQQTRGFQGHSAEEIEAGLRGMPSSKGNCLGCAERSF